MKPQRIQLRRTKGWRLPPNTVVVARPSKWGNPWSVGSYFDGYGGSSRVIIDRALAVELFKTHATKLPVHELAGKHLACWCPIGELCHADVLLELANAHQPLTARPRSETVGLLGWQALTEQ